MKQVIVGEDGLFILELDEEIDYDFLVKQENYLNNKVKFFIKGVGRDLENLELRFELEIVFDRIFFDKEIRLENIYYDFDCWEIWDDVKFMFNVLMEMLKFNFNLSIQLFFYIDCRGGIGYN